MRSLADALVTYMELKATLCRRDRGPVDCIPMIDVTFGDGDRKLIAMTGHPIDQAAPAITALRALSPVAEAVVLTEAIFAAIPVDAPPPKRGELIERHETEIDAPTQAALCAHAVDSEGRRMVVTVLYGYDDNGMPAFTRPQYSPNATGGLIEIVAEAMR